MDLKKFRSVDLGGEFVTLYHWYWKNEYLQVITCYRRHLNKVLSVRGSGHSDRMACIC